jgi:hypothetical protein
MVDPVTCAAKYGIATPDEDSSWSELGAIATESGAALADLTATGDYPAWPTGAAAWSTTTGPAIAAATTTPFDLGPASNTIEEETAVAVTWSTNGLGQFSISKYEQTPTTTTTSSSTSSKRVFYTPAESKLTTGAASGTTLVRPLTGAAPRATNVDRVVVGVAAGFVGVRFADVGF